MGARGVATVGLCCAAVAVLAACQKGGKGVEVTTTVTAPPPGSDPAGTSLATSLRASPPSPPPATKVFDRTALQDGVEAVLTGSYHLGGVTGVACPDGQVVKPGSTFQCTATIGGRAKSVMITIKTDDGDYEVGLPK